MARQTAGEVMKGLTSKSSKIRALAQAGYDRTEIAEVLGIRYQHVRKVLIDSGNTGGLRRHVEVEREPLTVVAVPVLATAISCEMLLKAGFRHLGEWTLDSKGTIALDAKAPAEPGVYAFTIGDIVAYIGVTNNGFRTRFDQYRRGHKTQKTNARVKALMIKVLSNGERITTLIATPATSDWNGLPVNTAAGLEGGLIQMLRPAWNILGAV